MAKVLNITHLLWPSQDEQRQIIGLTKEIVRVIQASPFMGDFCKKHKSWLDIILKSPSREDAEEFQSFIVSYCTAHKIRFNPLNVKCGGCGADVSFPTGSGYETCPGCGGLIGYVEEKDLYSIVGRKLVESKVESHHRYFDIEIFEGDKVVGRRHGWYDTMTGNMVQVG